MRNMIAEWYLQLHSHKRKRTNFYIHEELAQWRSTLLSTKLPANASICMEWCNDQKKEENWVYQQVCGGVTSYIPLERKSFPSMGKREISGNQNGWSSPWASEKSRKTNNIEGTSCNSLVHEKARQQSDDLRLSGLTERSCLGPGKIFIILKRKCWAYPKHCTTQQHSSYQKWLWATITPKNCMGNDVGSSPNKCDRKTSRVSTRGISWRHPWGIESWANEHSSTKLKEVKSLSWDAMRWARTSVKAIEQMATEFTLSKQAIKRNESPNQGYSLFGWKAHLSYTVQLFSVENKRKDKPH